MSRRRRTLVDRPSSCSPASCCGVYCNSFKHEEAPKEKKQDIVETKKQKTLTEETEKDRRKWAGNTNVVCKHIVRFNNR